MIIAGTEPVLSELSASQLYDLAYRYFEEHDTERHALACHQIFRYHPNTTEAEWARKNFRLSDAAISQYKQNDPPADARVKLSDAPQTSMDRQIAAFTGQQMLFLFLAALVIPLVGLAAGYVNLRYDTRRKQSIVLLSLFFLNLVLGFAFFMRSLYHIK